MITGNRDVRQFEVTMTLRSLPLPPNASLGIIYPSSPATEERVQSGIALLTKWGYRPKLFRPAGEAEDFLAAADEHRAAAVQRAFDDDTFPLVWAARGGYGVVRLLAMLDFASPTHPPLLLGFSDLSLLLANAAQRFGWPAVHGPNVTTLTTLDEGSRRALRHFLSTGSFLPLEGLTCLSPGRVTGPLLPMNLTLLLSAVGTPFEVDLTGAILLLEEVGEAPYRLDRMFQQLSMLRGASDLAGLVIGDLAGNEDNATVQATVERMASRLRIPCSSGAPVGHGSTNWPIPAGTRATLDTAAGRLTPEPFWGSISRSSKTLDTHGGHL